MEEPDMYVLSRESDGEWLAEDFSEPPKAGKAEKWRDAIENMETNKI